MTSLDCLFPNPANGIIPAVKWSPPQSALQNVLNLSTSKCLDTLTLRGHLVPFGRDFLPAIAQLVTTAPALKRLVLLFDIVSFGKLQTLCHFDWSSIVMPVGSTPLRSVELCIGTETKSIARDTVLLLLGGNKGLLHLIDLGVFTVEVVEGFHTWL